MTYFHPTYIPSSQSHFKCQFAQCQNQWQKHTSLLKTPPFCNFSKILKHRALSTHIPLPWAGWPISPTSAQLAPGHEELFFSPQKFTHLLTSTPKIGHKHISTTYHPHPHVNSIDQPLTHHDLLSPNIHTLFTISLQMSICSISHSLTKHTSLLKTPPFCNFSKILKHRALSTHIPLPWAGWPISPTSAQLAPGHEEFFFSPQKFTHLLTSTPKIGHKHISTTYHPYPHVNSIDQPLTHHDLLSPNIHTLFTISLQMSICSISHSLTKHTSLLKTPPFCNFSKILKHRALSTHIPLPWAGWPISPTSAQLAPGHDE